MRLVIFSFLAVVLMSCGVASESEELITEDVDQADVTVITEDVTPLPTEEIEEVENKVESASIELKKDAVANEVSEMEEKLATPDKKQAAANEIADVETPVVEAPVAVVAFNHQSWNVLLQKHVSKSGEVNYKGFKNDKALLEAYLEELKNNRLGEHATKNEKLAYWINVYNAFTVKLIVDNYPLKSIRDLDKAWDQKIVDVGKELLSLSHVENEILRKMNEPRIHFAINCASVSCPKLLNQAFTAEHLSAQLKQVTNDFFSDKSRNDLTQTPLALSKIFEWYAADFEKGAIVKYINKETDYNFAEDTKITFKEYDWSLNE